MSSVCVRYIPPNMHNPIEFAFSKIKSDVRKELGMSRTEDLYNFIFKSLNNLMRYDCVVTFDT